MPQFFLSYARDDVYVGDSKDPLLDRFYGELASEVSFRGGGVMGLTGFLDREQQTGANWPVATGDALRNCAVFVPIYSPNYFSRPACGQEWHAFSRRLHAHKNATGTWLASILPVWWVPPAQELPHVARYLQHTRDQFGAEYRSHGLRTLMMNSKYESQYKDFLERFALQVVAAASNPPPPLAALNLLAEPNGFTPAGSGSSPRTATGTRASGPKSVTFVVAAADRANMETVSIRTMLDAYGDDWADWRPFHPVCADPIVLRAQGVANAQKMISGLKPADDSLFALLDQASRRMELVVLIVDPWSVELPAYADLFTQLDTIRSGNSAILVPADGPEAEERVTPETRLKLYAFLGNWKDDKAYREDMSSIEEFEMILGEILLDIRARIINRATALKLVTEKGPLSRPTLTGPGG